MTSSVRPEHYHTKDGGKRSFPPRDSDFRWNDVAPSILKSFNPGSDKQQRIPLAPLRERRGEIPRFARNDIGTRFGMTRGTPSFEPLVRHSRARGNPDKG